MYSIKAFGDHRPDAEQQRTLCRPVPRAAGSVLLPGYHYQWNARLLVLYRRIVNAHYLAVWLMNGDAAFNARNHQVLDANVRKCTAHHHLVVAPPRPIAIEVTDRYSLVLQVQARR